MLHKILIRSIFAATLVTGFFAIPAITVVAETDIPMPQDESRTMFSKEKNLMIHPFTRPSSLTPHERLGKMIFFDKNLSHNENQSCAACHAPEAGWTGPTSKVNKHGSVYEGSKPGRFGNRKPPSAAYATQSPVLYYDSNEDLFIGGNFWDGRATGEKLGNPAADQAQGPFLNTQEQALFLPADVIDKICTGIYTKLYLKVCGAKACNKSHVNKSYDCVGLAIAAYEASPEVNKFSSKFDVVMAGQAKFTKKEKKGFNLFTGKGQCSLCHIAEGIGDSPALFTDYTFDNIGVPKNPENPFYIQIDVNPQGEDWIDLGLGEFLLSRPDYIDFADTRYGKQKVPTLRNVDKRPYPGFVKAYGHNGYFKSLKRIVHFYNTRDILPQCPTDMTDREAEKANCWPKPEVALNMNTDELGNIGLTDAEEDAIVAFMETLSDGYRTQ
jgi:cytochrome c peroxidase